MDDLDEQEEGRPASEGVRIIGADEAAAALEKGKAAGRRPDDAPRFGDVPPAPTGPRPQHRFPLSASREPPGAGRPQPQAGAGAPPVSAAPPPVPPEAPPDGRAGPDVSLPDDRLNVASPAAPEMPHWTDPPTGEVPKALVGDDADEDDLSVWAGVSRKARWRSSADQWDDDLDVGPQAGDEPPQGARDPTRSEHSDLYDFDEPLPSGPTAEVPPRPHARIETRKRAAATTAPAAGGEEMRMRVLTGVAVGAVALGAFALGTTTAALFAAVVVTACAFELFEALRKAGYLPATLPGLVATLSIMGGTYWKGERAIPLVLTLTFVTSMLWYLLGVVRARPTVNVAATVLGFVWVGVLGSFATLMLGSAPNHHGVGLLLGAVLTTVAFDVGSLLAGRSFGSHPLLPEVSPAKTWEGLLGGLTGSLVMAAVVVGNIHPWGTTEALRLGLLVAVVAPLGDLCESLVKRDIGIKDMSSVLPGHGGVLDRFDALLFVLPATYYLAQYLHVR
jgi:phosphatidate cytidylyltransferase